MNPRWTAARAAAWYADEPWRVGCNYLAGTAVNQLEMWQAETFDPARIDLELGWAQSLGFNLLRVYLHDLVWRDDSDGFRSRIDQFLALADRRGMKVLLTLFDDCHRTHPVSGPQPAPVRGVHNCGWMQSPGIELVRAFHEGRVSSAERKRLQDYVTEVMSAFADDSRVWMWDVYNEPGRNDLHDISHELLMNTWSWARSVRVSQPLTSSLEGGSLGERNLRLNAEQSDVLSFHGYQGATLESEILRVQAIDPPRPVICTEYMARECGTTFQHSLPILKTHRVAAVNWGLVAGVSQTHFNWQSVAELESKRAAGDVLRPGDPIPEPAQWFHDILRMDGSPYDPAEVAFLREITAD